MPFLQAHEAVSRSTTVGIQIDWTVSIGTIFVGIIFIVGLVIAFVKLQSKVQSIDDELKEFRHGLELFQREFKTLGSQVVDALVKIARLEGKIEDAPPQSSFFGRDWPRNGR